MDPFSSRILVTTSLLLVLGLTSVCQGQGVNLDALGPQVGDQVPAFTLLDQYGQENSLASLLGPNGLVLVFIRSADW